MALVINTNVASLNAQRILSSNTTTLQKSFERLASGYRINRAADDAAGLQISEILRSQIRGVGQALNNAMDGKNMIAIAEGTLGSIQESIQRIRELTVQAANDTNGPDQRNAITQEIEARIDEINRIAKATEWNGIRLLDPNSGITSFRIQIGPNDVASLDTIDLNAGGILGDARATTLGIGLFGTGSVNITTNDFARQFLSSVDDALAEVSRRRAAIGAIENRLESAIQNLQIARENFSSAESRIRNVDVAAESAHLVRSQILQQASMAILSQANQSPALALSLLQ